VESLRNALGRLVPAIVIAAGVTIVAAGLLSYFSPPVAGLAPVPSASPSAITAGPTLSAGATASDPVHRSPVLPSLPPTGTPEPSPAPPATRVVVPALGIDLPIVPGDLDVPGNPGNYPLCDVAQYLVAEPFVQPGEEGTTYIYAHAREGMFLPLLEASSVDDGASMLGALVQVYTRDDRRYLYEVFAVKRHATDFSIAETAPGEHRVVLQTSEGPRGTIPKLQVAARLLSSESVDPALAVPSPRPRVCA
jgi:hypothetical protein